MSGGNDVESEEHWSLPPEFERFSEKEQEFFSKKDPSLDLFVTFCIKAKSNRNMLAKTDLGDFGVKKI
ncbi:hypothetical protein FIC_01240 [Flavobacteriaceae bacterium 3519-10]|nr:hypothetical protein FIC_01240 [Flavobacteriaceae bacterium 3519-10]